MPPKIYTVRNSLNSGEISELLSGRDDVAKYHSSCRVLENAFPLVEGGAKKMPGTYFGGSTDLNNKTRLVPFQFNTAQGVFLELTAHKIRIWQNDALLENIPDTTLDYNPATSYVSDDRALVGPWMQFVWMSVAPTSGVISSATIDNPGIVYSAGDIITVSQVGGSLGLIRVESVDHKGKVTDITLLDGGSGYTTSDGVGTDGGTGSGLTLHIVANPASSVVGYIYIAAPYGQDNATTVPITMTVNGADALVVSKTGSLGTQGINIALANATASNNSAPAIQAAIRALGSLNSANSNYIDLSGWTVTPDTLYYAAAQMVAPDAGGPLYPSQFDKVFACTQANQYDGFPPVSSSYWKQSAIVAAGIIELTTPYKEDDLFSLDCSTQSADVLWITHASYPPACVERLAGNLWQYSTSLPGQDSNEPAYRGTPDVVKTGYSGLGQSIVDITQANPCSVKVSGSGQLFSVDDRVYINGVAGMVELNQGEFIVSGTTDNGDGTVSIQLQDPDTGYGVNSTGFIKYESGGFVALVIAMFASSGDYPACSTLYEERLCLGGTSKNPTRMYGSVQDDYPNFICDPNADDYAIQFTLVSNKIDQILNLIGTPNALIVGTAGGVWIMAGSNNSSLSQTSVIAAKQTSIGVGPLQPQVVNDSAIFVSRSARVVLFLVYNFVTNQWDNYDLTRLNRSITLGKSEAESGILQTAFQAEPYPIFWAVRADGQLIGLVFNKQDQVFAWFRVNMLPGKIESVAVISQQNAEDEVAVVVNRTINGETVRYVEFFQPQELFGDLSNAFFVYCGQQWYGGAPAAITGITQDNPCVVTAPGHGFSSSDTVQITAVDGMSEINQDKSQAYTIAVLDVDTFQLVGIDSRAWGAYTSGGVVSKVTNTVTGMNYLLGETVVAVGDGAQILQPTTVTGDSLTFPYYANLITVGLPYQVTIQPTNPVLTTQASTTRGLKQKLNRVTLSLYQSMGGQVGTDPEHMYDITYAPREVPPTMATSVVSSGGTTVKTITLTYFPPAIEQAPKMITGEFTRDLDADWNDESEFFITQSDPFPFCLRSLVMRMSYNPD